MADDAPKEAPKEAPQEDAQRFRVAIAWDGDGAGHGTARAEGGGRTEAVTIPIGASPELGGSGRGANPEELLLAAIGTCFVGTWAIFLKKLAIGYAEPSLSVDGTLEKDPAGGFKMTGIAITCAVPASLLAASRPAIEKTLQLAEKYCIISKVARGAMPLTVSIVEI